MQKICSEDPREPAADYQNIRFIIAVELRKSGKRSILPYGLHMIHLIVIMWRKLQTMRKEFRGRYYKCQSDTQTLAVIEAVHGKSRSVQIITDDGSWSFSRCLDRCRFSDEGFFLDLHENGVSAVGKISLGPLSPIRYDIMGPFRFVPFMQCRHSVYSMRHRTDGCIRINGTQYEFRDALGYIEGDRGRSFPKEYAWTQCFFDGGSLMLSVADIPFSGVHFTGVIGIIAMRGKEYRLATYLGARAVKTSDDEVIVRQGGYTFSAKLLEKRGLPLNAPVCGSMVRTIHESAACRAAYRFEKSGKVILQFESDKASFEYEYGGSK